MTGLIRTIFRGFKPQPKAAVKEGNWGANLSFQRLSFFSRVSSNIVFMLSGMGVFLPDRVEPAANSPTTSCRLSCVLVKMSEYKDYKSKDLF